MPRKIIIFLLFFLLVGLLKAQNSTIALGDIVICPKRSFSIPVMAYNFENTGALTLLITYDTASLKFDSISSKHMLFDKIKINEFTDFENNSIGISWLDIYGVSFDSLKICEIYFTHIEGTTSICFSANCEISQLNLNTIPANYISGTISTHISVYNQPIDTFAYFNESVFYSIKSSDVPIVQWEISTNNGFTFEDLLHSDFTQGVNNDTLRLLYCDTSLNNTLYRCKLENHGCTAYSNPAKLNVITPETSQFEVHFNKGWNSFSSYLTPGNPSIDSTFALIADHILYIGDGKLNFFPDANSSTLKYFNTLAGYQIKVADPLTFDFSGYRMSHQRLKLKEGWNLMPVLSSCNISIWEMDTTFLNRAEIIKDAVGINVYWPEKNVSSLRVFESGKSYFIKLKSEIEITFPECTE